MNSQIFKILNKRSASMDNNNSNNHLVIQNSDVELCAEIVEDNESGDTHFSTIEADSDYSLGSSLSQTETEDSDDEMEADMSSENYKLPNTKIAGGNSVKNRVPLEYDNCTSSGSDSSTDEETGKNISVPQTNLRGNIIDKSNRTFNVSLQHGKSDDSSNTDQNDSTSDDHTQNRHPTVNLSHGNQSSDSSDDESSAESDDSSAESDDSSAESDDSSAESDDSSAESDDSSAESVDTPAKSDDSAADSNVFTLNDYTKTCNATALPPPTLRPSIPPKPEIIKMTSINPLKSAKDETSKMYQSGELGTSIDLITKKGYTLKSVQKSAEDATQGMNCQIEEERNYGVCNYNTAYAEGSRPVMNSSEQNQKKQISSNEENTMVANGSDDLTAEKSYLNRSRASQIHQLKLMELKLKLEIVQNEMADLMVANENTNQDQFQPTNKNVLPTVNFHENPTGLGRDISRLRILMEELLNQSDRLKPNKVRRVKPANSKSKNQDDGFQEALPKIFKAHDKNNEDSAYNDSQESKSESEDRNPIKLNHKIQSNI